MNTMLDKDLISRCCWQLWILDALAVLVFPGTFSNSIWLGQTWLWLIAGAAALLMALMERVSARLVNSDLAAHERGYRDFCS